MNINKYLQISLTSFLAILLIGQFALPVSAADSPRFNIFTPYTHTREYNRDYYLLDLRNETKNTDWNDPISADAGDTLMMSVYYHNAVNETIARNTKIRVSIPSTTGTQIVSTAYLWADNAENATFSNPLTETGTANISSSQRLEYIYGSAKWYPDQKDWRVDSPTSFPFGQSGDEIVGSGVNIGDIEGCWEFSGYINFRVRVGSISPENPDLTIYKTVRNITKGETYYQKSTSANPGDRIAFSLRVETTRNVLAYNVIVSDTLPANISYVSGSTRIDNNYTSDGITSGGINIGTLSGNQSKTIVFEGAAASEYNFSFGTTYLTNYGYVRADNISQRSDTAQVNVFRTGQDTRPNLNLRKTVQNITNPNGTDVSNTASVGDTLKYTFTYQNTGNTTLYNVRIIDDLPSYLSVISADSGGIYNSQINQTTWNVGTVIADSGRSGSVSYLVRVLDVPGQTTIYNTGIAKADGLSDINSNQVQTVVYEGVTPPPPPPQPPVRVITGASDISAITAKALTASGMAVLIIYLIFRYFDLFTRLRLNWNTFGIRMKERLF